MRRSLVRWAIVGVVILGARLAHGAPPPELDAVSFLIGEWDASGPGQPGQASGHTAFQRSLQDRVIVRTNDAEYPASGDKPASRHDDLMVIHAPVQGTVRADYYDSEGHVIRYTVTSPGAGVALFVSEPVAGEPRYRLTYQLDSAGVLKGEFAVAPPGQPDGFRPYLSWESRRAPNAGR